MDSDAYIRFLSSSIASIAAETLTLPTDVAKTRIQIQKMPFLLCLTSMRRNEGLKSWWRGYTPAVVRQVCYSSTSLVLYEPLLKMCSSSDITFGDRLFAGGTAGAISISIFNPTEVVKTKIMNSRKSITMHSVIRDIYSTNGVKGFWYGVTPNISRTFLVKAAELGTYDHTKTLFIPYTGDGFVSFLGASVVAGVTSAVVSTPVDVVKTRMMNMATGTREYKNIFSGLVSITKNEGFLSLYSGFVPIVIRKILWCSSFFNVYEQIKKIF